MSEFVSDVTIVGGGIAGLWTAKELLDRGYGVNLVENQLLSLQARLHGMRAGCMPARTMQLP